MDYILDTHIFLWYINGNEILSENAISIINNSSIKKHISIISLWEIAIKLGINKLALTRDFNTLLEFIATNGFVTLPLKFEHLVRLKELEYHHKDPFDRLLIAQTIAEDLSIITADNHFTAYPVNVVL